MSATPDAFCCGDSLSSSSIGCSASTSKSSRLHTLDGDRIIGFTAEMTMAIRSTMARGSQRTEPVTRGTGNVFVDLGFTDGFSDDYELAITNLKSFDGLDAADSQFTYRFFPLSRGEAHVTR